MSDAPTSTALVPQRDERGRLLPGSTANPSGRPKGVAAIGRKILEENGGAERLFKFLLSVADGDLSANAKISDRLRAAEIYFARSYGQPEAKVTIAEGTARAALDTDGMSEIELLEAREHLLAIQGIVKRVTAAQPVDAEIIP